MFNIFTYTSEGAGIFIRETDTCKINKYSFNL